MNRSLIVAVAKNGVIGAGNRLPWKLPADLARFRRLTMGHHIIMGRKTYESIGRPLPGRTTIVLTRGEFGAPDVKIARTLDEALAIARGDDEPFVCGGGQIYALALPSIDRIYRTLVERDYDGDARFEFSVDEFELRESERHSESDPTFRFETWQRRRS